MITYAEFDIARRAFQEGALSFDGIIDLMVTGAVGPNILSDIQIARNMTNV